MMLLMQEQSQKIKIQMEIYIKQADILQQFILKAKMLIKVRFMYRENILMC